ncbi:MAG: ABC transporter substrate-binding protein [Cyanobacteria bacterium P01_C01_bin.72]
MNQKQENLVLLLSLLITVGVIGGGIWWLWSNKQALDISLDGDRPENVSSADVSAVDVATASDLQPSTGAKILFPQALTPEREAAAKAISNQNYSEAVSLLEQSLNKQRNDPEGLIYLNNARIGINQAHSIAVSVPIGTEQSTAQEILRGVAQAQSEINQQGGINGVPLKVVIVNDDNDSQAAAQVAQELVKDPEILGVVGHFSSGVTLATAPIYQQNQLVAISPTSTSVAISSQGDYIFRTVPSDRFTSNALAKYFLNQLQLQQAMIVYNSQSAYSRSLQETFTTEIVSNGGEIVSEVDLSNNNFNPAAILKDAQAQGVQALVFLNDSTTISKAYLLMQLNNRQLPLLAGDSLYKPQTLEIGGEKAVGLVLAVPWHALSGVNPEFSAAARRLWGGNVSWRTAMTYDASKTLIAGLTNAPSRTGVQKALSQSGFNLSGATGTIKFLKSGDRNGAVQLVEVQPGKLSSYGYDFIPLK